jgi:hypothetical protein
MDWSVYFKLSLLSCLADVLARSHPGRGLQWKLRCIWFSPEAEKLDEAVFPAFPLQTVWFVQQLWLCKQGSVRVKSACLQSHCEPISQLSDTQIQDHFLSSGIHTPSKHSQGQVYLYIQFYCENHFNIQQEAQNSLTLQNIKLNGKKMFREPLFKNIIDVM